MTDWRVTPGWQTAVKAARRTVRCRAGLVTPDGTELGAPVPIVDGTIRYSGESSEQWAADVTLEDYLWVPLTPDDYLDPRAGYRLRIWWELLTPSGWGSVTCGTFTLHDPDISDDGRLSMSLQGVDAITEAKRGGYGGQTLSVGGQTVAAALQLIFDTVYPAAPTSIPETTVTLPAPYELGARTPFEDWTEIALLAGWVVRADRDGVIVAGPPSTDPTSRATWQEGPDNRVTTIRREVTTSEMINRVVVVSTSPEVVPPILAIVEDTDESSPTWVGKGRIWEDRIESDAVATQDAADNLARLHYGLRRLPTETVTVRLPPRPDLDYRDVVTIGRRRVGATGSYRVSGWTLDLSGGPMELRTMARQQT